MTRSEIEAVVYAAYDARRWFKNRLEGNALNGSNDDVQIARQLDAAIRPLVRVVPPVNDADREEFAVQQRREDFFGAGQKVKAS